MIKKLIIIILRILGWIKMPRQRFEITKFDKGTISNADDHDLDPNRNIAVDGIISEKYGEITGMDDIGSLAAASIDTYLMSDGIFVDNDDDVYVGMLVGGSGKVVDDFYGTPIDTVIHSGKKLRSPKALGNQIFMGIEDTLNSSAWAGNIKPSALLNHITFGDVGESLTSTGINDIILDTTGITAKPSADYFVKISATKASAAVAFTTATWESVANGALYRLVLSVITATPFTSEDLGAEVTIGGTINYDGTFKIVAVSGSTITVVNSYDPLGIVDNGVESAGGYTITAAGNLDYYQWKISGGSYSGNIRCDDVTEIVDNVRITFANSGTHTLGNGWKIVWSTIPVTYSWKEDDGWLKAFDDTAAVSFKVSVTPTLVESETKDNIPIEKKYFYGYSLEYDNAQQSVIKWDSTGSVYVGTQLDNITLSVIFGYDVFPVRVTAVNIYRAEASNRGDSFPESNFRLVSSMGLSGWQSTGGFGIYSNGYTKVITDMNQLQGSYEANTGISDSLAHQKIGYAISESLNGYLFIGDCAIPDLDEPERIIFRSGLNTWSMFDWTQDLVKIPFTPVAMKAFLGRLYVFGESNIVVINPSSLSIEDVIEGYGIISRHSVEVVGNIMYWCDVNSVYAYNGREIEEIGIPIQDAWANRSLTNVFVMYDSLKQYLTFTTGIADTYIYSTKFKTWSYRSYSSVTTLFGVIKGKYGELYLNRFISSAGVSHEMFGGSSISNGTWTTPVLSLGDPNQKKKLYDVEVIGSNYSITFDVNEAASFANITTIDKDVFTKIQLIITATSSAFNISSITFLYREMIGRK